MLNHQVKKKIEHHLFILFKLILHQLYQIQMEEILLFISIMIQQMEPITQELQLKISHLWVYVNQLLQPQEQLLF